MGIVQSGLNLVRIGLDCIILQYFDINMIHELLTLMPLRYTLLNNHTVVHFQKIQINRKILVLTDFVCLYNYEF